MPEHVLLVDDEPSILFTLGSVLQHEGLIVETARSAHEAIRKLQNGTYEMVITDMHMETATAGFEVVRAANGLAYAPVTVILTGYASQCSDWQEHGVHALFEKPMNTVELLVAIRMLIRNWHSLPRKAMDARQSSA